MIDYSVIVWNEKENRKATEEEIKELIDSNKLFINYWLAESEQEGEVFIDIHDAGVFLIEYQK